MPLGLKLAELNIMAFDLLFETKTEPKIVDCIIANTFKRGDVCVIRLCHALPTVLRLNKQNDYKEWPGCFSLL